MRLSEISIAHAGDIIDAMRRLIGPENPSGETSVQQEYISQYLRTYLRARWLLVERDYVDRHYLDEFVGHYATNFQPPPNKTHRLHFFVGEASPLSRIRATLQPDNDEPREFSALETSLSEDYLGYVVLRPLLDATIGRTILRPPDASDASSTTPDSNARRNYLPADGVHDVHVAGLRLRTRGMPFQQQDQAVGACATTALWSALASAGRRNGHRTPTPLGVTQMATRFSTSSETGLELRQMCHAIQECGYRPKVFRPARTDHETFQAQLLTYLNSGFPVILDVKDCDKRSTAHAITLCGFRVGDDESEPTASLLTLKDAPSTDKSERVRLRMLQPTRFYMHDDNVGPYCRRWLEHPKSAGDNPRLTWRPSTHRER